MEDAENQFDSVWRGSPGLMFTTLSLLAEAQDIRDVFKAGWEISNRRRFRGKVAKSYESSNELAAAIEPLFNDIADRKRHLFIDDFLLDTPSPPDADNVVEEIVIIIPKEVSWSTEGHAPVADLGRAIELKAVCRAFWFVHSNGSLSYHLSFEVEYRHDWRDYYALSVLQKMVFPTENTSWAADQKLVRRADGSHQTYWEFVASLFEAHARHLFAALDLTPSESVAEDRSYYWNRLLQARRAREKNELSASLGKVRHQDSASASAPPKPSPADNVDVVPGHDPYPERRLMVAIKDPHFFQLLHESRRAGLAEFSAGEASTNHSSAIIDANLINEINPVAIDYYFLSGYFQNIIDFLRQDVSEGRDGTDPIFPDSDTHKEENHFILYANPKVVYEVVRSSRTLDPGRKHIGTCPYLFLVHVMTFHNEALVSLLERKVTRLVNYLDEKGLNTNLLGGLGSDKDTSRILDLFLEYRVSAFEEIAKHQFLNVFRYDTERAFFDAIQGVRGSTPRRAYWEQVLAELEDAIGRLRDRKRDESEDRLNRILLLVAVFSVLQVLFQVSEAFRDWSAGGTALPVDYNEYWICSSRHHSNPQASAGCSWCAQVGGGAIAS